MDEPGCDAGPDHIHKEVADGKEPGEGVLQALILQGLHDAGLVLGPSCTNPSRSASTAAANSIDPT